MWPPWSRFLEVLGRVRVGNHPRTFLTVGDPSAPDARGGQEWRDFLSPEALFRVWGPLEGSPWEPFHSVPLFAALDRLPRDRVGPTSLDWIARTSPGAPSPDPAAEAGFKRLLEAGLRELGPDAAILEEALWPRPDGVVPGSPGDDPSHPEAPDAPGQPGRTWILPSHARPGAPPPPWIDPAAWIVLDLPGRSAVEAAAWLVTGAGVQPVCTFDHWPHHHGVLRPENILAELLRWASTMAAARGRIAGDAPPLWICDSERLGAERAAPGEFDNRYFMDDSILPGPGYLARAGVRRVIYLASRSSDIPVLDLEECFSDLLAAGFPVHYALISDPAFELRPFAAPPTPRRPKTSSFRRSSAGGFGTEVPQPSSGGGG